jgi:hypothetical protein
VKHTSGFWLFLLLLIPVSTYGFQTSTEFPKADSIAEQYPRHPLDDLKLLSGKLIANLSTDEGKFRAIYKWVCLNIDNDYMLAEANRKNRAKLTGQELVSWNVKLMPMVHKKLIGQYSTVCTGYAWLIKELAAHAGLQCELVHGYGRTTQANIGGKGLLNHTWNAVKLDEKWYLCDATWSSGALNMETTFFVRNYEDAYFLAKPEFFIRNHYPADNKWALLDQYPTLAEFLNKPLIYVAAFNYEIQPLSPAGFNVNIVKRSEINFRFTRPAGEQPDDVKLIIAARPVRNPVEVENRGVVDIYSTSHTFPAKGTFAVHIFINDRAVVSYEVTVR